MKVCTEIAEYSKDQRALYSELGFSESREAKPDLLPEYCRYQDEGCEFAASCLNCPLPKCIYDQPGGKQRWLKRSRDKEIVSLFSVEGEEVRELAVRFGVSQRTVQRALGRAKNE